MLFTIIGISDSPQPHLNPDVLAEIKRGKVFSGGRRHHQIVASLLPADAVWIDIVAPLDTVFEQYVGKEHIVVFASGDPLFYGFANTVRRMMPEAEIKLFPTFNSLQSLSHRLVLPYHDMRIVSLTGRPWHEFDRALIECAGKIGVLTDGTHTPDAIARRMIEYGYTDYIMHVGEQMGNPECERVTTLSLEQSARRDFAQPNCLILAGSHRRRMGIPDNEFALLDGRERMITKMPIRLLALQALGLVGCRRLWDIGFCTGSISIEARLMFPHLHVTAFEVRPECKTLIETNARRFGAPGIDVHIGDFLEANTKAIAKEEAPDAIFIGGHGGRLVEIMQRATEVMADDACIVMNSVTPQSRQLFDEACQKLQLRADPPMRISLNDYNPIEILKCRR